MCVHIEGEGESTKRCGLNLTVPKYAMLVAESKKIVKMFFFDIIFY